MTLGRNKRTDSYLPLRRFSVMGRGGNRYRNNNVNGNMKRFGFVSRKLLLLRGLANRATLNSFASKYQSYYRHSYSARRHVSSPFSRVTYIQPLNQRMSQINLGTRNSVSQNQKRQNNHPKKQIPRNPLKIRFLFRNPCQSLTNAGFNRGFVCVFI